VRRRKFIALLGSAAAAWPVVARAQQPALPEIGYLSTSSADNTTATQLVAAFRQGLKYTGYVEGQNVAIEYRWADGDYDRLPALAADLVHRRVAVIISTAAQVAKAATNTIPIVFLAGGDPVTTGLVASFNRPGGNVTGVYVLAAALEAKRLELLQELVPQAEVIGILVNPAYPLAEQQIGDVQEAARVIGRQIYVLKARSEGDIDIAFATLVEHRIGALLVGGDPFFSGRVEQFVALAARYAVPTIHPQREFAATGGLMSYGTSLTDGLRQVGIYTGRILKGEKPAELPVQQSTKVELVINLKTAKTLGLTFPLPLLGRADEVIE
jgi:putative tryptophan/tyrosine transport system substrate-binding protein